MWFLSSGLSPPHVNREYGPFTYVWPESAQPTQKNRWPYYTRPSKWVSGTPGTEFGLASSACGHDHGESKRSHPTMDKHQLVRNGCARMFIVPSTLIAKCKWYDSHAMGHAGVPVASSIWRPKGTWKVGDNMWNDKDKQKKKHRHKKGTSPKTGTTLLTTTSQGSTSTARRIFPYKAYAASMGASRKLDVSRFSNWRRVSSFKRTEVFSTCRACTYAATTLQ